ncbi:MAG: hypothetical protein AAGF84_02505 [Planctomycetota bacterium]
MLGRNILSATQRWFDMACHTFRRFVVFGSLASATLLAGCATDDTGQPRPPADSIRGILAALPPLDTAGMTDEQIAEAERARYLDAVLESKQRRDRRRRQLNGGRGPW